MPHSAPARRPLVRVACAVHSSRVGPAGSFLGATSNAVISALDLVPTLADLARVGSHDQAWDGTSFLPELLAPGAQTSDRVLHWTEKAPLGVKAATAMASLDRWAVQRVGALSGTRQRWKLSFDPTLGFAFYDLSADPFEGNNLLVGRPPPFARQQFLDLLAVHSRWRRDVGVVHYVTDSPIAGLDAVSTGDGEGLPGGATCMAIPVSTGQKT